MTVTAVQKDPEALTLTLTAEFDASPGARVGDVGRSAPARALVGPPTYPATFTAHDLGPGSRVEYHMTGPSGDQPRGYWDILKAEPPRRLVFRDGFANDDGTPNDEFLVMRSRRRSSRSRPAAAGCPSKAASPAQRRCSSWSPWAWSKASPKQLARSTLSSQKETQHDHDDRVDYAHPGRAGCHPHLRRPQGRLPCPGVVHDRFADGCRCGSARSPGISPIAMVARPARRRAEHEDRSASQSTPEQHADDVHRIITEPGVGPVDLFASSGGAVNALALVAKYPEDVRTLVAHEPPPAAILPDRESSGGLPGDLRHVPARRVRRRHGAVHRHREPPGPDRP